VRLLIAMHLAEHGFSVVEAASADDAVAILQEDDLVALVFSDIQMPGETDGVGLAQWIGRERPDLKVLLTSGRAVPATAGAWPFIPKPYRPENVESRLRTMADA